MENCNECVPTYWDELSNEEKMEVLRRNVVSLLEQVSQLNKLKRHTHSLSGKVAYEEMEFLLPRSQGTVPCGLRNKPKTGEEIQGDGVVIR